MIQNEKTLPVLKVRSKEAAKSPRFAERGQLQEHALSSYPGMKYLLSQLTKKPLVDQPINDRLFKRAVNND